MRRKRRLLQIINFDQSDPARVFPAANHRGVETRWKLDQQSGLDAFARRKASRGDLGFLAALPIVILRKQSAVRVVQCDNGIAQRALHS